MSSTPAQGVTSGTELERLLDVRLGDVQREIEDMRRLYYEQLDQSRDLDTFASQLDLFSEWARTSSRGWYARIRDAFGRSRSSGGSPTVVVLSRTTDADVALGELMRDKTIHTYRIVFDTHAELADVAVAQKQQTLDEEVQLEATARTELLSALAQSRRERAVAKERVHNAQKRLEELGREGARELARS